MDLLKRVYRRCSSASEGDKSSATAVVARFLRRCLSNVSVETRANSRRPSPRLVGASDTGTAQPVQDAMDVYFDIVSLPVLAFADVAATIPAGRPTA